MKINTTTYDIMQEAIAPFMPENATERERWDALWASGFDLRSVYGDGIYDEHIDTALRAISAEKA